jgi:hypothetical protein
MRVLIREEVKDIDVVTIAIVENFTDNFKMFNCPTCKNPVFQYKGRLVSIIPGYAPTEIPILIQCSNSQCRQKYLLSAIFSREV